MLKSVHVASLFIYAAPIFPFFVVLSSLIYVVSTQIYVASTQQIYVVSRFVSSSTFSIILEKTALFTFSLFIDTLQDEIATVNTSKFNTH